MVDTPNKKFPLMASNQSQKHVTYNEFLVDMDVIVQSSVISAAITAPPGSPVEGGTYIIPSGATGAWSGHTNKITMWYGGAWVMQTPQVGWRCWNQATSQLLVFSGGVWASFLDSVFSAGISDSVFTLSDNADSTKKARFELSGISTGTTRTYTLPNIDSTIAVLSGVAQTFANSITFSGGTTTLGTTTTVSGTMTITAASATLGNSTATSTYNLGTGATLTATTKTINIGTAGVSGSTTVINIGSAVSGALGTTIINSPTVTFANSVTTVGMPQANLTALYLGLGGATANASNRFSINTPQVLLNNAGAGIEMTFNKNAAGNDASLAFKTGFSTRALIGLLGNDDTSFKVSPNGSSFFDAMIIDRSTGRVDFPAPIILPQLSSLPATPGAGDMLVYGRSRAGTGWLDVQMPSGRDTPLQHSLGVSRVATWAPSTSTTVVTSGMPRTAVGTVSTPTLASTNLSTSMRRWRNTSAAVVNSVADERSAVTLAWRGNAAGLGGWRYVNRISLVTLQATGMGFFGMLADVAALSTTLLLSGIVNGIGIGFQRGTHTNFQLVHNDGAGAPTLVDLGASFAVNTTNVITLFICCPPNGSSIGVRVVEETSGASAEYTLSTDIPAATTFLSVRNYMNNDTTAAAIAYDCSGVYLETDY